MSAIDELPFDQCCIYCGSQIEYCTCDDDNELSQLQGQEEHDDIDAGVYDDDGAYPGNDD
jgi:hypothetical protein